MYPSEVAATIAALLRRTDEIPKTQKCLPRYRLKPIDREWLDRYFTRCRAEELRSGSVVGMMWFMWRWDLLRQDRLQLLCWEVLEFVRVLALEAGRATGRTRARLLRRAALWLARAERD